MPRGREDFFAKGRWLRLALLLAPCAGGIAEPSLKTNLDMPGFDYRNFQLPRAAPRLCQEACLSDERCKAWTYVRPERFGSARATCWLKSRVPDEHANPCCVSGVR